MNIINPGCNSHVLETSLWATIEPRGSTNNFHYHNDIKSCSHNPLTQIPVQVLNTGGEKG